MGFKREIKSDNFSGKLGLKLVSNKRADIQLVSKNRLFATDVTRAKLKTSRRALW